MSACSRTAARTSRSKHAWRTPTGNSGSSRVKWGRPRRRDSALEKAVELRRQACGFESAGRQPRGRIARELFLLGQFHFEHERPVDARPAVQESVESFHGTLETKPRSATACRPGWNCGLTRLASIDPDQNQGGNTRSGPIRYLSAAAKKLPDDAEVQTDLARLLNNIAVFAIDGALECPTSRSHFTTSRASAQTGRRRCNPASSDAHSIRQMTVKNRATLLARTNQLDNAVRVLEDGINDSKAFVRKNPAVVLGQAGLALLHAELASVYERQTRFDQAIESWNDAARTYEALSLRDPKRPTYDLERIRALTSISEVEKNRNHLAEAAAALDRADSRALTN